MKPEKLTISLLGPPTVTLAGKPIRIRRRIPRYLLFYLACEDHPVSRTAICDIFWPEISESESRKNLRESLSILQTQLQNRRFIIAADDYLSLKEDEVQVDIRQFETVAEILRRNIDVSSTSKFSDELYLQIQEALQLWEGENFLAEAAQIKSDAFQKWAFEKNQVLEFWHQQMLEWMVDHCVSIGNLSEALIWSFKVLEEDPRNTEMNILALNCLKDLRANSELLHFCQKLEVDYQVDGKSTLPPILAESIKRARETASQPLAKTNYQWDALSSNQLHFVGRSELLASLQTRVRTGGITLILGEFGSGKSRLLKEFYTQLNLLPRLVYHACKAGDEKIPYKAYVEGLRPVLTNEDWLAIDSIYAKVLLPLFPYVMKIRNDIRPADLNFAIGLNRLIPEAFFALDKVLASKRKVLFVMDDAQWCDSESLGIIAYVHEHGGADEVGSLIMTSCVEIENPDLSRMFDRFGSNAATVIEIPLINQELIKEITFLIMGEKINPTQQEWLQRESGGNAAFLIELLNSLKAKNLSIEEAFEKKEIPVTPGLERLIRYRWEGLDKADWRVLTSAAVLNRINNPEILETVSDLQSSKLERALNHLIQKRILRYNRADPHNGYYEFCHEIEREKVIRDLNEVEYRRLHLNAVNALQTITNKNVVVYQEIAEHYQAIGEISSALENLLAAGKLLVETRASQEIYSIYQKALDLCVLLGDNCQPEQMYDAINTWSQIAFELDDVKTAEKLFQMGLREGERRREERLISLCYRGLGWVAAVHANYSRAMDYEALALEILGKDSCYADKTEVFLRRGIINARSGKFKKALEDFQRVNALLPEINEFEQRRFCMQMIPAMTSVYTWIGEFKLAQNFLEKSMFKYQNMLSATLTAEVDAARVILLDALGSFREAAALADSTLPALESLRLNWWIPVVKQAYAKALFELGKIGDAWRLIHEVFVLGKEDERYQFMQPRAKFLQGELFRRLGQTRQAKIQYESGFSQESDEFNDLLDRLYFYQLSFMEGNIQEYEKKFNELMNQSQLSGYGYFENVASFLLLQMTQSQMEDGEFFAKCRQIEQLAEARGNEVLVSSVQILQGTRMMEQGNISTGIPFLEGTLKRSIERGHFWNELMILQLLIPHASKTGRETELRQLYGWLLGELKSNTFVEELEKPIKKFIKEASLIT